MTALLIKLISSGELLLLKKSIVISIHEKGESNTQEKTSKSENKHGKWSNVVLLTGRFFTKCSPFVQNSLEGCADSSNNEDNVNLEDKAKIDIYSHD